MPRRPFHDAPIHAFENPFEDATHPLPATYVYDRAAFLRSWEKLEKAARKLGVDVGYEFVGEVFVPADPRRPLGPRRKVDLVQVWGDAPKIEGWEFLGRIDNLDQTHATVSFAPGKERLVDPSMWQANTDCHHCRVKRYRTKRYILQNVDDGRIMVVGGTCLKDFFGHASPQDLALAASFQDLFDDVMGGGGDPDGMGGGGSMTSFYYGVKELMPVVASLTTKLGFRSSKAEEIGKPSTANLLLEFLSPPKSADAREAWVKFRREVAPGPADDALAAETLEWARNLDGVSAYEQNIRAIASVENIGYRQIGMFASMVFAYTRARGEAQRRQRAQEERPESVHLGTVGEKIVLDLTLRKAIELEGIYGTTYLYLFVTPDGNDVVWKASKRARWTDTDGGELPIAEGETYRMQAKVKEHGDYKGRPQTKIERAKVLARL